MKHSSIKLDTPVEFINVTPLNPLISKCQIKVCYVSDEPNRNRSVITKEVARGMANSLPGCPIVGFYNEAKEDFEEHNRIIDISNGEFKIKDTTKPYGFVDLNAKVWFQKFLDDDSVEREYMVTEGYLWTKTYPECQRVIDQGNNQSMELDPETLDATWAKDDQGKPQFFIINEAIISKLCILGEDNEPCFEGASISDVRFSFEDGFKEQLFGMMNELKEFLQGGEKVFTTYAVEIGDSLWTALYQYLEKNFPDEDGWCSIYRIEGIYEDENSQKFAVIQHRTELKYYRLNFSISEENGVAFAEELIEVTKDFVPSEQFTQEDIEAYEAEYAKNKQIQDNSNQTEQAKIEDTTEEEITYSLDEIPEYVELLNNFNALQGELDSAKAEINSLNAQLASLATFKKNVERKEKEAMIAQFYMLNDEDKKDVIDNIDTYSLDEIEAKLSVICVRNKVSFELDDEEEDSTVTTFNLNNTQNLDESTPAWVRAALTVAKNMN